MRYRDYIELEDFLLKKIEKEEKMSFRKFLAIFELNALESAR